MKDIREYGATLQIDQKIRDQHNRVGQITNSYDIG